MFSSGPQFPRKTLYLGLILPPTFGAMLAWSIQSGPAGLPMENAYIIARYAENVAQGFSYSFNPGEPSYGATSLLWTLLNALFLKLFPSLTFVAVAQALGMISYLGMIVLIEAWVLRETKNLLLAILAAVLGALSPMSYMNAVSGMDSMFFTGTALALLYFYRFQALQKPFRMGCLAALVFHIRAEGLYLVLIVAGLEGWLAFRQKNLISFRRLGVFLAGFLLVSGIFESYLCLEGPGWLPLLYYHKSRIISGCRPTWIFTDLEAVVRYLIKGHGRLVEPYGWVGGWAWSVALLAALKTVSSFFPGLGVPPFSRVQQVATGAMMGCAAALAQFWDREGWVLTKQLLFSGICLSLGWLVVPAFRSRLRLARKDGEGAETSRNLGLVLVGLWPVLFALGARMGPLFGGYYNRFLCLMVPAWWILTSQGVSAWWPKKRVVSLVFLVLVMTYSLVHAARVWGGNRALSLREVYRNEGIRTLAAHWLRDHTPEDAIIMAGHVGIGVVGGRSNRYALDLGGLVNHDIYPFYRHRGCLTERRWQATLEYMKYRQVNYFVTFSIPSTDPHLDPSSRPGFNLVGRVQDESAEPPFNSISIWEVHLE